MLTAVPHFSTLLPIIYACLPKTIVNLKEFSAAIKHVKWC